LLSSNEFSDWSKQYVAFLHVTTRVDTDKHQDLLQAKGFRGFPSLCFMDEAGDVIAKHSGPRTLDGLDGTASSAGEYLALRERASTGDAAATAQMFVKNLELGHYSFSDGMLRLAVFASELDAATVAAAESTLIEVQIQEMAKALRDKDLEREAYMAQYAEIMSMFFRADRMPSGRTAMNVLMGTMNHAQANKDVGLFERALSRMKQEADGDQRYDRMVSHFENQLQQLRDS